jgi:hypothetical protein
MEGSTKDLGSQDGTQFTLLMGEIYLRDREKKVQQWRGERATTEGGLRNL